MSESLRCGRACVSRRLRAPMGSEGAAPRRYRALVVEDDPAIRRLVEKLLRRHSIDIDAAADGRTAIEKLKANRYSVLVLDLMVPELKDRKSTRLNSSH